MSGHYDPWMHALHLWGNRVIQFVLLTLLLGASVWELVIWGVFHAMDWLVPPQFMWKVLNEHVDLWWVVILGQSVVIGALMSGWLFTWLRARARLRRGDRHHRGTRVVFDDHDDE